MDDQQEKELKEWRQGDFALDVAPFIALVTTEDGQPFEIGETSEGIRGIVIVSQTCDIVSENGERHFVTACALVERPKGEGSLVRAGRRPHLVPVEFAPENTFADLSKTFSVKKDLLASWPREIGFSTDEKRHKFGFAIARKFGNFAFPDSFDEAVGHLKQQAWKRHEKDSDLGKIYRSLREIRFKCDGGWSSALKRISILAVLQPEGLREAEYDVIYKELKIQCDAVKWPDNYEWSDAGFELRTAVEFSAADIYESQAGDFEYLCM